MIPCVSAQLSFIDRSEVKNKNVSDRERLFDMMQKEFSRSQWADAAEDMSVPLSTADSWLKRMVKAGAIVNTEERGKYRKMSARI